MKTPIRMILAGIFLNSCVLLQFGVAATEPNSMLLPSATESGDENIQKLADRLSPSTLRPRVVVQNAVISIDGVPRADLGISFSDAVAARLMESGAFEVLDPSALAFAGHPTTQPAASLNEQGMPVPNNSSAASVKSTGAEYVIAPTVVGTNGDFHLTARKLRVSDGKIDRIFQHDFKGSQQSFSALAKRVAGEFLPAPEVAAAPADEPAPVYSYVKVWMAPPPVVDPMTSMIASAPKALRASSASSVSQLRTPVQLGTITKVEPAWSFCEVSCPSGGVQKGDEIFVRSGPDLGNLITLKVSRLDGNRVIAEFDSLQPITKSLRPGNSIYAWKTLSK